ncbi:conserved hypothetical protein [Betalipothrixvirus acidiani]|uniref:Uncharacterized protein n=2 Tax=Betalipothrixvirus TaxID=341940 RepID=A7WKK5_9VIRU|nr:hypothetical protein AFV6_gp51 [Acidianus filamentous virus 6]YP_001604392.1 hypothetical protein AFV3_gp50 [Acidianus filamentous virus 3]CAJ31540.1 conserved hypothetical protein [Acidianus filamentous virus 3]CAJ31605.1 conserved hypothetical protein [Acidianus filamentous virus 6]
MSYYYQEEIVDITDIFEVLNVIKTTNPAQYRQLYVNTVYQFLYILSNYLSYFPPGTFTLFESDSLTVRIVNNTIQAIYNGSLVLGLLQIAQVISSVLSYDFALLNSFLSAVYYNLVQIARQIVPPDNVKQYLQDLYNTLTSKV